MAEFGVCHRNEPSGSLHGLFRREFTQDDAHIFCTESQLLPEILSFSKLLLSVYEDFGFQKVRIKLADRPDNYLGEQEGWDRAEAALHQAMQELGTAYSQ